ncbi:MAG: Phosphohydrolase [Candidatus Amesbacteria bacterium GW2011_GWA1_44_24]|nr:MAG: Phosphohydrolase [Candidatus Amesbacteria bacterium GW2011_GWA1_44_24]
MYIPYDKLPRIGTEALTIPFVGAIIERLGDSGEKEIIVQTRSKESDPKFSGTLEIPGGKFRAGESIYQTVRREVLEESGLEITLVGGEDETLHTSSHDMSSDIFHPFCVTQSPEGPFVGFIFRCTATGTPASETNETKGCHWIKVSELKTVIETNPGRIYTPFLGALSLYIYSNILICHLQQR